MTFNEHDVNRKDDGKFGEKTGGNPEVDLGLELAMKTRKLAVALGEAGRRHDDITEDDMALVTELEDILHNSEAPSAAVFDLREGADEFAARLKGALEPHGARRIESALAEAMYNADPEAPIENPTSAMQISANARFVHAAAEQYRSAIYQDCLESDIGEEDALRFATKHTDDHLMFNPNLSDVQK